MAQMDLVIDYPSRIADMLLKDEIDMGLVPVAIIPSMREYFINGNICIGSNGPVASVCIFSETPLEQVDTVLLDYQSRTSVALARVLLAEHWKLQPKLVAAEADYRTRIQGCTAGVVIGDRALEQRKISKYTYDLGEAWKAFTGLPFVFAAWISNKPLPSGFIAEFEAANRVGLKHIEEVVAENPYGAFDLHDYFTRCLDYELDDAKRKGLSRFLQYLSAGRPAITAEPIAG